jgi:hypothetical protein
MRVWENGQNLRQGLELICRPHPRAGPGQHHLSKLRKLSYRLHAYGGYCSRRREHWIMAVGGRDTAHCVRNRLAMLECESHGRQHQHVSHKVPLRLLPNRLAIFHCHWQWQHVSFFGNFRAFHLRPFFPCARGREESNRRRLDLTFVGATHTLCGISPNVPYQSPTGKFPGSWKLAPGLHCTTKRSLRMSGASTVV